MNFMRICWGRPPGLGLAIGRARRQAGSLCLSDSAEGGIALLLPPCGRLTYKSRCAQCKYELTGMNKLGYANAGGRSAGMREAHSGLFLLFLSLSSLFSFSALFSFLPSIKLFQTTHSELQSTR